MKSFEIVIAGTGGQGLMVAGNILAKEASEKEDKNVTQRNYYGAEKRGGIAYTEVKISDEEIIYPNVENIDVLVILHQNPVKKFAELISDKTIVIYDSEQVNPENLKAKTNKTYGVNFTVKARELNATQSLNIISLGTLVKLTSVVNVEKIIESIKETFPKKADVNASAFLAGYEAV